MAYKVGSIQINTTIQAPHGTYQLSEQERDFEIGQGVVIPAVVSIRGNTRFRGIAFVKSLDERISILETSSFFEDPNERADDLRAIEHTLKEHYKKEKFTVPWGSYDEMVGAFKGTIVREALEIAGSKERAALALGMKGHLIEDWKARYGQVKPANGNEEFSAVIPLGNYQEMSQSFERELLAKVYRESGQSKALAAQRLSMPRMTFSERGRRVGIFEQEETEVSENVSVPVGTYTQMVSWYARTVLKDALDVTEKNGRRSKTEAARLVGLTGKTFEQRWRRLEGFSYDAKEKLEFTVTGSTGDERVEDFERQLLKKYFSESGNNQSEAAEKLKMARSTLSARLKQLGIVMREEHKED